MSNRKGRKQIVRKAKSQRRGGLPVAKVNRTVSSKIRIKPSGNSIRVRHREYIGEIDEVNRMTTLRGNPLSSKTFPWLSRMASLYEKYKVHSMTFEYKSMASTLIPGAFSMSFDYDPKDSAPNSKQNMLQNESSVSGSVWANHKLTLKRNMLKPEYFLDSSNMNTRFTEFGELLWYLQAPSDSLKNFDSVGELYVTYDIEFISPQVGQQPVPGLIATNFGETFNASKINKWSTVIREQDDVKLVDDGKNLEMDFSGRSGLYEVILNGGSSDPNVKFPIVTRSRDVKLSAPEYVGREFSGDGESYSTRFLVWIERVADTLAANVSFGGGSGLMELTHIGVRYLTSRISAAIDESNDFAMFKRVKNSLTLEDDFDQIDLPNVAVEEVQKATRRMLQSRQ